MMKDVIRKTLVGLRIFARIWFGLTQDAYLHNALTQRRISIYAKDARTCANIATHARLAFRVVEEMPCVDR